jgi:hypothetical protein
MIHMPTDPGELALFCVALFLLGGSIGFLAGAIFMLRWTVRTLEDDS